MNNHTLQTQETKTNQKSDIRTGYEAADYARFLAGVSKRSERVGECLEWRGSFHRSTTPIHKFGTQKISIRRALIELRDGKPMGLARASATCGNNQCVSPSHAQVKRATERPVRAFGPKIDARSEIRAGYEDGNYPQFLAGLHASSKRVGECLEWQRMLTKAGYPTQAFGSKAVYVHRLVIEAREGMSLGVLQAHHKCANRKCVSPDHLQAVTHRENMAEMLSRTSLEARIEELEAALIEAAPNHEVLSRVAHML